MILIEELRKMTMKAFSSDRIDKEVDSLKKHIIKCCRKRAKIGHNNMVFSMNRSDGDFNWAPIIKKIEAWVRSEGFSITHRTGYSINFEW